MDHGSDLEHQVVCQRHHLRPILDVWSKLNLLLRLWMSPSIIDTVIVDLLVEEIFLSLVFYIQIGCSC